MYQKNKFKMKIKPLLIIAVLVAIALFLSIRGCQKHKQALNETSEYLELTERKFKEFKTTSELNAARVNQQLMTLESLLALKKREVAKLANELSLRPKRIREIVEVTIEGKDSIILKRDTVYYPETMESPATPIPFVYEDKWNSFQAFVDGDQIGLLYAITDSITLVTTNESGYTQISALSSNPAIRVTGLSSVKIPGKKKVGRFGIGPSLTVGYTNKPVFVPGIGVHWSLIRF